MLRHLLLALSLGASLPAAAFTFPVGMPSYVQPATGLWWSPGENGQFMQLAIGPGGYALATLTDSDAAGQPRYRILQAPLELLDSAGRRPIASLASPLYRVVGSSCLECGPADGRTEDTGARAQLTFVDGTHAELRDGDGRLLRRYELFPLLTRAADTLGERVAGQRFVMTAWSLATRHDAIVRLVEVSPDDRCEYDGLRGARNFHFKFEEDPNGPLARQFSGVRLQVGPGVNPLLDVKTFLFDGSCVSAYRMHDRGSELRGLANAVRSPPAVGNGESYFARGLTLQWLPVD